MYKNEGYMAGVNLGHWISQYGTKSHEHFKSYIREEDITRIASWGMDHIRLPVDYPIFESDDKPGIYMDSGLIYIDSCLEWCKKNNLNLVLDLHHAPGFFFGHGEKNCLLEDKEMQERFINIWTFFAIRYKNEKDNIIFELLNELVADESGLWNDLWMKTADAIHAVNPNRKVMIGGNNWNSVTELCNLTISDNPNILYTFHMYHPMIFTHQKASWMDFTRRYEVPVEYPVNTDEHTDFYAFTAASGENDKKHVEETGVLDKEYLRKVLTLAFEFIKKNNRPLYCGEYGVIANADVESAIRWCDDVAELMLSHGIGRALWSYRGFSKLTDNNNDVVSLEYVKTVSRK